MTFATVESLTRICSSIMTVTAALVALQIYRRDRRQRIVERQAEVHRLATGQWHDIVKIGMENPEVRPYILRGMGAEATSKHLFFELVALHMAYICLVETRQESGVAGSSWIAGWHVVFSDFLRDHEFREFVYRQQPFYDECLQHWINKLAVS